MTRWQIALLATAGALAVLLVVMAALRVRNLPLAAEAPAATPVSKPASTMAMAPPDASAPATLTNPALLDVEQSIHIVLPPGWQQSSLEAIDLHDRLQAIALAATDAAGIAALLLSHVGGETVLATARLVDDAATPVAIVTVSAISRNALTLEGYLTAVERILLARSVKVHAANIEGSLRSDGLPVATMHYTLAAHGLDGYQVVAYDASGTKLIVFTFTASTIHYADLLPQFHEVVHSTTF